MVILTVFTHLLPPPGHSVLLSGGCTMCRMWIVRNFPSHCRHCLLAIVDRCCCNVEQLIQTPWLARFVAVVA